MNLQQPFNTSCCRISMPDGSKLEDQKKRAKPRLARQTAHHQKSQSWYQHFDTEERAANP